MHPIIIVFAILILILAIVFVLSKRIVRLSVGLIYILFPAAMAVALSALFIPDLYFRISETIFAETPFVQQLKNFDSTVNQVKDTSEGFLDSIKNIFNNDEEEVAEVPTERVDLYSGFITFIGDILRWFTLIIALIIMFITIYVRFTFSSIFEVQELRKRVEKLEKIDVTNE